MPKSKKERIWKKLLQEEEDLRVFNNTANDLSRSDLPPCKDWNRETYVIPLPGTILSAKDWTMHWIPHLASDAGPRWLQYANTFQMLCEVSEVPQGKDCFQMCEAMLVSTWVRSLDASGTYLRRDPGELSFHSVLQATHTIYLC
jgi:hypothetical protein